MITDHNAAIAHRFHTFSIPDNKNIKGYARTPMYGECGDQVIQICGYSMNFWKDIETFRKLLPLHKAIRNTRYFHEFPTVIFAEDIYTLNFRTVDQKNGELQRSILHAQIFEPFQLTTFRLQQLGELDNPELVL